MPQKSNKMVSTEVSFTSVNENNCFTELNCYPSSVLTTTGVVDTQ